MLLTCISIVVGDVESLVISLLATRTSFWEKRPFKPSTCLKNGCLFLIELVFIIRVLYMLDKVPDQVEYLQVVLILWVIFKNNFLMEKFSLYSLSFTFFIF